MPKIICDYRDVSKNSTEFPNVHKLIKRMIYLLYLMNLMQLRGVNNRGGGRLMGVGVRQVSRDLRSIGLMDASRRRRLETIIGVSKQRRLETVIGVC
jgi:hypothetical protein